MKRIYDFNNWVKNVKKSIVLWWIYGLLTCVNFSPRNKYCCSWLIFQEIANVIKLLSCTIVLYSERWSRGNIIPQCNILYPVSFVPRSKYMEQRETCISFWTMGQYSKWMLYTPVMYRLWIKGHTYSVVARTVSTSFE